MTIRILYDNVADDILTLTASTTAGSLAASNLLTEIKAEVHRSTATSVTYTLTWSTTQILNMAALVFANLTSTATIRARGYTNTSDSVEAIDSGTVLASAYAPFGLWDWGMLPLGVNAFSFGGAAYGRVYFTATPCKKLVIDVVDVDNTMGYVEVSRLVTGAYWSPETNPEFGMALSINNNTKHERSDAGDLRTERRPIDRSMKFEHGWIKSAADRARLFGILWGNGMTRPAFISLFPEDADPVLEQHHQIYGKLSDTAMAHPKYGVFAAPMQIEEM